MYTQSNANHFTAAYVYLFYRHAGSASLKSLSFELYKLPVPEQPALRLKLFATKCSSTLDVDALISVCPYLDTKRENSLSRA